MKNQAIKEEDFSDSKNYFQNKYFKVENEFLKKDDNFKQIIKQKADGSIQSFKNEDYNENSEKSEEFQNLNARKKQTHNKSTGQHMQSDELQQDFQMLLNQDFESQNSNMASQNENRKEKETIGSYYSKNQEISVIIEMGKDQEDEITSIQESAGLRKSSVLSKYTTTYVINQQEYLSNSSIAQESISQPNMYKQNFNSQQRSRKQKRQSLNISLNKENKLTDILTVTENIIDEHDPNLIQPCIISNSKNSNSNFKNILEHSDLVNLKNDEKQEFLEFLKEENEKEIEKEKNYNLLLKEMHQLESNLKNEKGLHQQELDSHKLQIWILEDKIQQMNHQIVQIKFENDSHSQNVTDISQQIQTVKSQIQTRQNQEIEILKEYDQYKNLQTDLQQKKDILEKEFITINKESEEEQSKLKIDYEENVIKQSQFDELTIKQQELENQKNLTSQNKNKIEFQIYQLKKEIQKVDEDTDDNKQIYERNLLEKDMFETQLSYYLKQQSILTKDVDVFQKKKQFHQEFIHYGDKSNKSLFKIIQDNFMTIDNLKSQKLQIGQNIDRLTNDQIDIKCQIDQVQMNILNLNSNLDQLCNLSNNINNVRIDFKQELSCTNEKKEEENQIQIQENIKMEIPQTNFHTRVNSIQNTNTILNSRQESTCHTRSQTVCEDELNQFYQNIRKNQLQNNQYFVDEPVTYREQITNDQTFKDCHDDKSECITIQNKLLEQFQYQDNQPQVIVKQNNIVAQKEIQQKYKQKVKEIPQQQNKSPFDLNNIFISKNSQISQDTKCNWDMPLTKKLQNCVPLNQKNSKKIQNNQYLNCFQNICESKENQFSSKQESDLNSKCGINLSFVNPLRKSSNSNNHKKTHSKSSDFDKLNIQTQKMNFGKQLNKYIDEIEHKNNKSKQQYNQICVTVKNIIKKSDRNYIIDKKSKRTNKSSECSIANGSKCSTFRQNLESDKKLTLKNEIQNKVQIDKKNKCLARFVLSKNLEIPDEPLKKQKLKQFIKTEMPESFITNQYQQNKLNEELEKTLIQRSQSQSMSSTQIFERNNIRNSLPFRKKQDKSLDILKGQQKWQIPLQNIQNVNYETQYQQKESSFNANQHQMYKSKTAQRLVQENQFISQKNTEDIRNKYDDGNIHLKCEINQKNSYPLRTSSSNQQIFDFKQKYQSDTQKSNIQNTQQINLGTSMKQTDDQIKYSKPFRQNKNLSHTICSESHALSPGHLKFNSEIDDCLSSQFQKMNQNKENQNNVISPDIKYRVFKKSISSNLLTRQKELDLSFKSSQDNFKFKSKFAKQSLERKTPIASQNHQYFINQIFKNETSNPKNCNKGIKMIQESYFTDGFQKDQSKASEQTNSNIYKQTSQKYSKYLLENLKKNSMTSEQGEKYFNIAQKHTNISQSISNPQNISSIENKISQSNVSFENSQKQLFKVIQKEFINHGELSLKSNFAKRKFEMHVDQNQSQFKIKGADLVQNKEQILQQSVEFKKSSSIKKKSKYSKLSQFLQPISKCDEASSKICEQKDLKHQQKMEEELKILQEQIFLEVKNQPASPKQPKSAFIGRKKGKIQDDISSTLNEEMQILQSQKNIPATPNDSMKKEIPLYIYEGESLRNKSEQKKICKISERKYLKEDKENISPAKSTVKSKNQKIIILDQEFAKINLEYKECKDLLKEDLYSDDSHISLREQDEIISQLKSNKDFINHY